MKGFERPPFGRRKNEDIPKKELSPDVQAQIDDLQGQIDAIVAWRSGSSDGRHPNDGKDIEALEARIAELKGE